MSAQAGGAIWPMVSPESYLATLTLESPGPWEPPPAPPAGLPSWHSGEHTCGHSCNLPASAVSHSSEFLCEE